MQDEIFIQYLKFLIETEGKNGSEESLSEKAHKAVDDYILSIQLNLNKGV